MGGQEKVGTLDRGVDSNTVERYILSVSKLYLQRNLILLPHPDEHRASSEEHHEAEHLLDSLVSAKEETVSNTRRKVKNSSARAGA